jgi:hypothetical protein
VNEPPRLLSESYGHIEGSGGCRRLAFSSAGWICPINPNSGCVDPAKPAQRCHSHLRCPCQWQLPPNDRTTAPLQRRSSSDYPKYATFLRRISITRPGSVISRFPISRSGPCDWPVAPLIRRWLTAPTAPAAQACSPSFSVTETQSWLISKDNRR